MHPEKQKRALVIGVSDYADHSGFRQLPFCRNDGMDMCSLLTELGYATFGDPEKLIGYVKFDDMRVQINDFLGKDAYGPDDNLILYFSGHGFVDKKGNGYMCCSDMEADRPYVSGYPFRDIMLKMRDCNARVIAILDCCYSGQAAKWRDSRALREIILEGYEQSSYLRNGKYIMASSLSNQESYINEKFGHSIFTFCLMKGLKGDEPDRKSVDHGGNVTAQNLATYVHHEVNQCLKNEKIKQEPIIEVAKEGNLVLAHYGYMANESQLFNEGMKFFMEGQHRMAIQKFDSYSKVYPNNFHGWYFKGLSYFTEKDYEMAVTCFNKSLRINPTLYDAVEKKGFALNKLTNYHPVSVWGNKGSDPGEFNHPQTLALDSHDNVYVADTDNNRIQKFTSNGKYITEWGSEGSGSGEFNKPRGIALDSHDNVYVADTDNNRIQKFTSNGKYITEWGRVGFREGSLIFPPSVYVDGNDYLYICQERNFCIKKFDCEGTPLKNFDFSDGSSIGISHGKHLLKKIIPPLFSFFGEDEGVDNKYLTPVSVAIDSDGNMYMANNNWGLGEFFRDHFIYKFNPDSGLEHQWGKTGSRAAEFRYPHGVILDSFNNVYVVDSGNHRIQKFNNHGGLITKWGSKGSDSGQLNDPKGIAIDSNDDVYVADTNNHRIQKFSNYHFA